MADIHVFFWFDVEDYITPESDDALQGILTIFETHKVRGTFKIVGEKLRALKRRGRWDIINALRRQDIGYHTDYHSVHPTPRSISRISIGRRGRRSSNAGRGRDSRRYAKLSEPHPPATVSRVPPGRRTSTPFCKNGTFQSISITPVIFAFMTNRSCIAA